MSKKSKKDGSKGKKASVKSDRVLLELGEDLLTAVHLQRAVQDNEVRAALAAAHADLAQAAGDLVARIAERFLEEAGVDTERRDRYARWAEEGSTAAEEEAGNGTSATLGAGQAH